MSKSVPFDDTNIIKLRAGNHRVFSRMGATNIINFSLEWWSLSFFLYCIFRSSSFHVKFDFQPHDMPTNCGFDDGRDCTGGVGMGAAPLPAQSAAGVDVFLDGTDLAGDLATPFETAMTVDAGLGRSRFVASAATQQFAAFDARWRTVADPAGRAQRSSDSVRITIVRRFFRIDQIFTTRRFDTSYFRNDGFTVVTCRQKKTKKNH